MYWRDSAVGIFIECHTESKGIFSHCLNEYQLAFDGEAEMDAYMKDIVIAVFLCIVCVAVSIPVINKRQL